MKGAKYIAVMLLLTIVICLAALGMRSHPLAGAKTLELCIPIQEFSKFSPQWEPFVQIPVMVSGNERERFFIFLEKKDAQMQLLVRLSSDKEAYRFPIPSSRLRITFSEDNQTLQIFSANQLVATLHSRLFLNARAYRNEYFGENPLKGDLPNHFVRVLKADCLSPFVPLRTMAQLPNDELLSYFFKTALVPFVLVVIAILFFPFIWLWLWRACINKN